MSDILSNKFSLSLFRSKKPTSIAVDKLDKFVQQSISEMTSYQSLLTIAVRIEHMSKLKLNYLCQK